MSVEISIIIPTLNEGSGIRSLIAYLQKHSDEKIVEILVADGGSKDDTLHQAAISGAIPSPCPVKGRANQMNFAARKANGKIFYFVHADTFPPASFQTDILTAVENGYGLGRYITKFDSQHPLLKFNEFFTRFDFQFCYGGDQTLFIKREVFDRIEGFNSGMMIMEDYDIVMRARKLGKYKIIKKKALISARKYDGNSWLKVQKTHLKIVNMFKKGRPQRELVEKYNSLICYR